MNPLSYTHGSFLHLILSIEIIAHDSAEFLPATYKSRFIIISLAYILYYWFMIGNIIDFWILVL